MSNPTYQRSTDTAATVTGLQAGRGYYVKVRVITADGVNRSAYSDAVRAWTSFAVPTGLKVDEARRDVGDVRLGRRVGRAAATGSRSPTTRP